MTEDAVELELRDRLKLIESMIAEGRRTTESFAWTFVLWGLAYYVAIAWSTKGSTGRIWGSSPIAWPVTMAACFVLTMFLGLRKGPAHPMTTHGRAISSIWISMGISMFVLLLTLGLCGRGDQQLFIAVIAAMMGTTNSASAILLKWKQQFACAVVWWAAVVVSLLGTVAQSTIAFLVAIFLCQIVFGIYGMRCEARARQQGANHA